MKSGAKPLRLNALPAGLRAELKAARLAHGWSQLELGRRSGLPQVHISSIETGKTVPRYDTLLDLVRVLGFDLVMAPGPLVPAIHSLIRDSKHPDAENARPLYAFDDTENEDAADES